MRAVEKITDENGIHVRTVVVNDLNTVATRDINVFWYKNEPELDEAAESFIRDLVKSGWERLKDKTSLSE